MTSSLVGSEMCIRDRQSLILWFVQAVVVLDLANPSFVVPARLQCENLCCLLYTSDAADDM
eukprot:6239211-Prorocentrum_lima.AAC.1